MITFQYFDECPNAKNTLDNLKEVLKELEIPEKEIEILEIPDLQKAEKFKFQGSPTILIDGLDIYLMQVPEGFSYTCRIYNFKGGKTGIIPKYFIKEKITELRR